MLLFLLHRGDHKLHQIVSLSTVYLEKDKVD